MTRPLTDAPPDSAPAAPTIAYVSQIFPFLTETFVYREVDALRAAGFDVITLSNRRPAPDLVSPEAHHHLATTAYVFPVRVGAMARAHAYWLARRPLAYLRALWTVMSWPGESARNRRRTFGHFCGAALLAYGLTGRRVDHIHAHFAVNAATMALVIAALLDTSFSFTVHNNIFTDKLLLRLKLERARFIAAISEYSRQYLLRWAPDIAGLAARIHVVRCGIAPEQFTASTSANGRGNTIPRIFSLARFDEKKGMPVLVKALARLRDAGRAFHCDIGGDGPQFDLVREQIARHGLENNVTLLGRLYQDDVRRHYEAADLFVLACVTAADGDVDGIPVVLMEAMALERPVVSTTVSGIPELIENGVSGVLVAEKSAEQLAAAIGRLLDAPEERRRLGRNGRSAVVTRYNIHDNARDLAALFQRYVGRPAGNSR